MRDGGPYAVAVSDEVSGPDKSAPFSVAGSWDVLRTACARSGLDHQRAELMRFGENALFHLVNDRVVVRIARTMGYWPDAAKEVNVARWLASHDFPASVAYGTDQPIEVDGHPVTFWDFIDGRPGDLRDIATLGMVLRRLHKIPRPATFVLPDEQILDRVAPRISAADIPATDKDFLLELRADLAGQVAKLSYPLLPAPTHGDAHSENLMIRDDGEPVLIDFERFAWGQPEWDLAMTATEYLTAKWWTADQYAQFCDAYGYDVTTWNDGFSTLQAVHELKMTTWLMQNVAVSPEIAQEYQVRMRTLRGQGSPGWRPF
jgi:aminoglycoside phosphotransferase (APT) family kinase protein